MADSEDQHSKTEEPTERKLRQLREDGNVPTSREIGHVFALVGMLILFGLAAPFFLKKLLAFFVMSLQSLGGTRLDDPAAVGNVLQTSLFAFLAGLLPLMAIFLVFGYVGGVIQNGFMMSSKPLEFNLEKISPVAGFGRLFSLRSVTELVKSVLKFALIGFAMFLVARHYQVQVLQAINLPLLYTFTTTQRLVLALIGAALVVMLLLAIGDYLIQRFMYLQKHRMSLRELKDEFRESEGDPHIKQRQRQIRAERARKRMMAAVPSADVVITNPTHYAVALRYKPEEGDEAPKLVAKGLDHMALRIREVATEHGIPLYEDPPLARRLYAEVEVDHVIPVQLYEVVAKVIAFVMNLKRKKRG